MSDIERNISDARVLVLGDIMLDRYIYGGVSRVSPEAPVPVVNVAERKVFLGGAANVASGISALGSLAGLIGAVGADADSFLFRELAEARGVAFIGSVFESRKTTVKTRVIGNGHQLLRYDDEHSRPLDTAEAEALNERLTQAIVPADILLISDYAKGVCVPWLCQRAIALARDAGIRVVVDPKTPDWGKFSGADIITPNFEEFKAAAGAPRLENKADAIREPAAALARRYGIGGVLVTRSRFGMTYVAQDGGSFTKTATAKEIFDVTGAGDTAVAALAVFLAARLDTETAAELANAAAGIAVGRPGTYAVGLGELMSAAGSKSDRRVVFTNGCFDILHSGHLALLERARAAGDYLVVGLNSDDSVRRLKGPGRPVNPAKSRAAMLLALKCVDSVVVFEEDTPLELIKRLKPDVLVKGGDYTEETAVGAELVRSMGGEVIIVPLAGEQSTTDIIKRIKQDA